MIKGKLFILSLISIILFTSCHKHDEAEPVPVQKEKTIIVYIVSENSLNDYTWSDLNEMKLAASQIPANCNYVIYLDDIQTPRLYTLNAHQGLVEYKTLTERNSCDPDVFRNNLQDIISKFPAEQYGLVMWSHGSGWIPNNHRIAQHRTIGVDNNINSSTNNIGDELAIADMRQAIEQLGIHFKYILFDACFMQCAETAYELRNVTDYIIASPAEIPAFGAPYHLIMNSMVSMTEKGIRDIVKQYYEYYKNASGVVISAVKCDEMENLLKATKSLLPDFYTQAYDVKTYYVQKYCDYNDYSHWHPEYFDMGSTMNQLLPLSDYTEWLKQAEKTVITHYATPSWATIFSYNNIYYMTDMDHSIMMSLFIPNKKYDSHTKYNNYIKTTLWYQDYIK